MLAKILIVDDSATDRLIIKNMLSGYNILTACDGIEALHVIDSHSDIDLVILDLKMPNMDGFQVLSVLKSDARYKDLRTIILTNYDELDNEIKGLNLGAVDFIRKPIHMDSLKVRIDIHVELLRVQRFVEQKLYESRFTFDTVLQQAPIGIAISPSSEPVSSKYNDAMIVNKMFEQIPCRTKTELIKLGWVKITHPDDVREDMENLKKLRSGEIKSYSMEKRFIKPDGSSVWVHMVVAPLTITNDDKYKLIHLVQDISQRKETEKALAESERSKTVLLSHLPGMAYRCHYDQELTMQYVSAGCNKLTGYAPENLLYNKDLSYSNLITLEYREPFRKEWERTILHKLPFKYEYEIITAQGERKWVLEMGEGIYDEKGEVEALEGIILDISDRKKFEDNLRYNSEHDIWTGLYNRRYLEKLLNKDALDDTAEKRALVGINLSSVHLLSKAYGFHYSQELIKKVANALNLLCADKRQLCSISENVFVFYVNYQEKKDLLSFCDTVISALEAVLAFERIGGGIGIVEIIEDNKHDVDRIIKNILIASEKAINFLDKDFEFCIYDTDMEAQLIREEEITRELVQIAEGQNTDRLYLQFQPILDLKTNQICGFEALARLNSDKYGLVPPLEFIPIAERTKLIIPMGEIIIHKALGFLKALNDNGYDAISVSINISAIQMLRKDFAKKMINITRLMQVNPQNICLEITESIFASNYEEINRVLSELKSYGIKIAIDDFGTGYSSLARERELNINCLKIDKYFIDKLLILNSEEVITGDIISMAHKLGHCVIAEGVEHEKQLQYLQINGCDKVQGFWIGKPMDEYAALELHEK